MIITRSAVIGQFLVTHANPRSGDENFWIEAEMMIIISASIIATAVLALLAYIFGDPTPSLRILVSIVMFLPLVLLFAIEVAPIADRFRRGERVVMYSRDELDRGTSSMKWYFSAT